MKKSLTKTSFIFLMIFLGISFFSIMINSPILTALENTTFLRIIDFINQNYISKGGIIISFATNIRDVVNIFISVFYRLLSLFSILSLILSIIFSNYAN